MKTRLLKKIRKRFEIIRMDELASNAKNYQKKAKIMHGLPFFIVKDKECSESYYYEIFNPNTFKTFQEAKNDILKTVLIDYKEKFRHKDSKKEKVWYNK